MAVTQTIQSYFLSLPSNKSEGIIQLFKLIKETLPQTELHFFDGKNEHGKVVTNPTIGFGNCRLIYTDGKYQDTFRIGICATSTGLSIYILGLKDKNFLRTFLGNRLGKAKVTGYAIGFKKLSDVDEAVLKELARKVIDSTTI